MNIFVHGIAATPTPLLNSLCQHAKDAHLKNVRLHHLHLEGKAEWIKPEFEGLSSKRCLFIILISSLSVPLCTSL